MNRPLEKLANDIYRINGFLSEAECRHYLDVADETGFRVADVQMKDGRAILEHIRNNERADLHSEYLADELWQRLRQFELPVFADKRAIGLSPRLRFYRYRPGQKFNMHKDGRQDVDGRITQYTLLIYLQAVESGGETEFRQEALKVAPSPGLAVLFEHHLWHKGCEVLAGEKVALRADVIYA